MTRPLKIWLALAAASLAIIFALAFAAAAKADPGDEVSQRVNTTTLTLIVHGAQARVWSHNIHKARGFRTRCAFQNVRGPVPDRTGDVWTCVFRVYRHTNATGRLMTLHLTILMVPRYQSILFEDGSGWRPYPKKAHEKGPKRSVYMNPGRITG